MSEESRRRYQAADAEMRERWNRSLPPQEHDSDRWERAKALGFGEGASIYASAYVLGDVSVGEGTWIGPNVMLDGSGGLSVGAHCSISTGVQLYSHNTVDWALSGGRAGTVRAATSVGDDCFIGPNSVIAAGVTIGSRCCVGALSFVRDDVPDGSIAVGSPARVVGRVVVGDDGAVELVYD